MKIRVANKREWHEVFAIIPRKIDHTWIWLETYLRRECYIGFAPDDMSGRSEYEWEYKLKESTSGR